MEKLRLFDPGKHSLYCNKKSAISITYNPIQHDKIKYVEIELHFIKENVVGILSLLRVPSEKPLVNLLTKSLSKKSSPFSLQVGHVLCTNLSI